MFCSANINESYFTNRQDRYLHFTSPSMAQYCFSFLRTMKQSCFRLQALSKPDSDSNVTQYALVWPDPSTHPERIEQKTGAALQQFQDHQLDISRQLRLQNKEDVWIFPMIQGGQFGIREEERCLALLFKYLSLGAHFDGAKDAPLMDLTSGYFGLYDRYQELVRLSRVNCRILAASPQVCLFYLFIDLESRQAMAYFPWYGYDRLMDSSAQGAFLDGYLKAILSSNSAFGMASSSLAEHGRTTTEVMARADTVCS